MNLTTATPAEIDTKLDELQAETAQAQATLAMLMDREQSYRELAAKNANMPYYADSYTKKADAAADQIPTAADAVEATLLAEAPFHAEFLRRGGWTRAFLVITNGKGHVHRTTACTTCYSTTQFVRLSQFSGMNEQAIVDNAGERACTVCYASAPVELRLDLPTKMFSKDEIAAQAARAEREAKRAAAKGAQVIDAEGKVLFKTDRGATNEIASTVNSMVHYGPTHPSFNEWIKRVSEILDALVLKGSISDKDAYYAEALDKQRAKVRKDHKAFKKTAQYQSWLADGIIDEATLVEGYDAARF